MEEREEAFSLSSSSSVFSLFCFSFCPPFFLLLGNQIPLLGGACEKLRQLVEGRKERRREKRLSLSSSLVEKKPESGPNPSSLQRILLLLSFVKTSFPFHFPSVVQFSIPRAASVSPSLSFLCRKRACNEKKHPSARPKSVSKSVSSRFLLFPFSFLLSSSLKKKSFLSRESSQTAHAARIRLLPTAGGAAMFAAYAESGRCVGKGRDKAQARGRRGGAERERAMGSKTEERKRADCSLSTPTFPPGCCPSRATFPLLSSPC